MYRAYRSRAHRTNWLPEDQIRTLADREWHEKMKKQRNVKVPTFHPEIPHLETDRFEIVMWKETNRQIEVLSKAVSFDEAVELFEKVSKDMLKKRLNADDAQVQDLWDSALKGDDFGGFFISGDHTSASIRVNPKFTDEIQIVTAKK